MQSGHHQRSRQPNYGAKLAVNNTEICDLLMRVHPMEQGYQCHQIWERPLQSVVVMVAVVIGNDVHR